MFLLFIAKLFDRLKDYGHFTLCTVRRPILFVSLHIEWVHFRPIMLFSIYIEWEHLNDSEVCGLVTGIIFIITRVSLHYVQVPASLNENSTEKSCPISRIFSTV